MAKDASLLSEIHKIINHRMEEESIFQASDIVDTLFDNRPLSGDHASFYQAFARKQLVKMVTRVIRNVGMSDDPAPLQLAFPGHTRLVKSYPVERNGARVLVPISLCTAAELRNHIMLLRKQATGCEHHANELEIYIGGKEENKQKLHGENLVIPSKQLETT